MNKDVIKILIEDLENLFKNHNICESLSSTRSHNNIKDFLTQLEQVDLNEVQRCFDSIKVTGS